MNKTLLAASLALAAAWPNPAAANLPPGLSGSWYNPDQPGHGLSIQMHGNGDAVAFWYVFDGEGRPVHLYIQASSVGDTLIGEAYAGSGMRFGSFDPAEHKLERWGRVYIDFESCDQARLSWDASGPAGGAQFAPGEMTIRPLVKVAGGRCDLDAEPVRPSGLLVGRLDSADTRFRHDEGIELRLVADDQGGLWGVAGNYLVEPYAAGFWPAGVVFGGGGSVDSRGYSQMYVDAYQNTGWAAAASQDRDPPPVHSWNFALSNGEATGFAGSASFDVGAEIPTTFRINSAGADRELVEVRSVRNLAGTWSFESRGQFFINRQQLSISASGEVCVASFEREGCDVEGSIDVDSPEATPTLFRVELRDPRHDDRRYSGVGWVEGGSERSLVLVARSETRAMGFVLRRED